MKSLEFVLDGLMHRYKDRVPYVNKITQALIDKKIIEKESDIENDHIAFRTMGVQNLGLTSFEKIFIHLGYKPKDDYFFADKKLNARWYAPPNDHFPRIFISELRVGDFSEEIQKLITSYTDEITSDPVDKIDLNNPKQIDHYLHAPLWKTPSWSDYQKLSEVSEYAAWVIYNRYYLNHYTIGVHNLGYGYNTLSKFNELLNSINIPLNDSGGYIKKSADGLLLQSSTVSEPCEAIFAEGDKHLISGSYVEFAERRVLPEFADLPLDKIQRTHRRDGFETANADKIFESTFSSQTQKAHNK